MVGIEHQMSIFDMIEKPEIDDLTLTICKGSGYEGGRVRIYAAAVSLSAPELARFLQNEYGIGGSSISYGFVDYDSNGLTMRYYKKGSEDNHEVKLKWTEVAKKVKQCIAAGLYLRPWERKKLDEIRAAHDGKLPLPNPRFHYE